MLPKHTISGGLMADPRAFVSFDFDNNQTEKNLLVGRPRTTPQLRSPSTTGQARPLSRSRNGRG